MGNKVVTAALFGYAENEIPIALFAKEKPLERHSIVRARYNVVTHVENEIPVELFEKHGPLAPVRRKPLAETSRNCDHHLTMWALMLGAARSALLR